MHHFCVAVACFFVVRNTLCDRHPCARSPLSPPLLTLCGFFVVACLLACLALPDVHKAMCMSLNIESGGVRGTGQVVHNFVRQPLASEAFLLQSPRLLRCFCKDGGTYMQTCYSVLHDRQEAAACNFQTPEQLLSWRNVLLQCSCVVDSACEAHRRSRMKSVAHIQTHIRLAPIYAPPPRFAARKRKMLTALRSRTVPVQSPYSPRTVPEQSPNSFSH